MSTYDENDSKTSFIIYQKLCIISGIIVSQMLLKQKCFGHCMIHYYYTGRSVHTRDGGSSCHCACARDLLSATLSSLLSRVSAVTC